MEKNGMKKVMLTLMMLMMVVVAQGRAAAAATDFQPDTSIKTCAKSCALHCALQMLPSKFALCFSLCMIECKIGPGQAVYDCTRACAKSAVDSDPKAGRETVQGYVDSCYGTCKNKA